MPRVPAAVPAEAGADAACQGGAPWGGAWGDGHILRLGAWPCAPRPQPVSNRSLCPQSTHGVPRNVDELSSLQSSADSSSSRPGPRVPAEPPALSVTARGSALPSSRWGRPEANRRAEARPRLRNTGWTCQECQEWVPDRESYVSHMKKSHGRVSVACAGPSDCPARSEPPPWHDPLWFLVPWAWWAAQILSSRGILLSVCLL